MKERKESIQERDRQLPRNAVKNSVDARGVREKKTRKERDLEGGCVRRGMSGPSAGVSLRSLFWAREFWRPPLSSFPLWPPALWYSSFSFPLRWLWECCLGSSGGHSVRPWNLGCLAQFTHFTYNSGIIVLLKVQVAFRNGDTQDLRGPHCYKCCK